NDIEFVTAECKHKGDCAGTCPKCESEVAYLEEQLARRRRLGFTTRVAGLALGLAAIAPAAMVTSCTKGDIEKPDEEQLQGDVTPVMGVVAPPESSGGQE
ncbi:MAG: energy transducer TonB, partial [Bacteroidales bacterium]|nr:energy transducer TonB [Bacteroidales bacterium]